MCIRDRLREEGGGRRVGDDVAPIWTSRTGSGRSFGESRLRRESVSYTHLIIDELSLGLAPIVVAELLETLARIKEQRGQTIIVVEQSLNVALQVADRAVFLEKGEVRFEGPAHELAERDDLARAVFLGREGG